MTLSTFQLFGALFGIGLIVILVILFFRYHLTKKGRIFPSEYTSSLSNHDILTNRSARSTNHVFTYRPVFFQVGLFMSITMVFLLFQWTVSETRKFDVQSDDAFEKLIEVDIIPQTTDRRPALPQLPRHQEIVPVEPDPVNFLFVNASIEETEIVMPTEENSIQTSAQPVLLPPIPLQPEAEPIWIVAEDMPRFPGCEGEISKKEKELCAQQKMLAFIYTHINYPAMAIANRIEGTAVVSFVVEKDGTIHDAKIVREIGGGCAVEAHRVIELMNTKGIRWIPGKQQGKPVRVQFNLPVKFRLQ